MKQPPYEDIYNEFLPRIEQLEKEFKFLKRFIEKMDKAFEEYYQD